MWAAASPSRLAPGTFASDPDCVRSTARRFAGRPRPGRAWRGGARADPRRLASTPATLATTPTASSSPSDDASLAEEDPFVARRRRAEEALMSAIEFDAAWLTDATVRGRITGEGAVAPPPKTPRRRPGYKPTASDLAREAAARDAAASAAHTSATLYDDQEFRRVKAASLYAILQPACTPRDVPARGGDGGGVARFLAAAPAALADVDPRRAARALVRLRVRLGDDADLVSTVSKDPASLLAPIPERDDSDEAVERRRAARREAASRAMRTVTARVGARVLDPDRAEKETPLADGREDGRWRVGGTLKGTSDRAGDLTVRFWNLWGGSSECRRVVTESPRGSVYRDPARMEAAVVRLDRYVPFVDAPMLLHRAPKLLESDAETLVRRIARLKNTLRGGDVGQLLGLAPTLLLAEEEEVAVAVRGVAAEAAARRGGKRASDVAVFEEVSRIVREGGAESLLARGRAAKGESRVVPVTERANVHFTSA